MRPARSPRGEGGRDREKCGPSQPRPTREKKKREIEEEKSKAERTTQKAQFRAALRERRAPERHKVAWSCN